MPPSSEDAVLAHAAELERRDDAVAAELETIRDLEERTAGVRARAVEAGAALERIPIELEELGRRRRDAELAAAVAHLEAERAAERVAALASSPRWRVEELERARNEAATARDALTDANARRERVGELEAALRDRERALVAERDELGRVAAGIAADVRRVRRIAETAGRLPGAAFADVDEWAAHVRSVLFVVRGTLEAERERIVAEANVLGASVLGEDLGVSSIALVRRRLEARPG